MPTAQYGTDTPDVYGLHARQTIESHRSRILILPGSGVNHDLIREHGKEPHPKIDRDIKTSSDALPVAIIGAGVGGLYTAMILESLDIPFKIIEASDRTGGRLLTHKFSEADAQYYDVGAMRFPIGIPLMSRLKKLFAQDNIKGNISLIPFKFISDDKMGYLHYNGVRTRQKDLPTPPGDFFHFSEVGVSASNPDYFNPSAGYHGICGDVLKDYVVALTDDLQRGGNEGWKKLMSKDRYSTRAYMSLDYKPNPELNIGESVGLSDGVIGWCESMDTGSYDRALSEPVLDAMAFGTTDPPIDPQWMYIDGGSAKLTDAMALALKTPDSIVFQTPVTAIGLTNPELGVASTMTVEYSDGRSRQYSHVVSTLPLPVLRTLDLSNSNLTLHQQNALRQLQYAPNVKIGVQFKSAWWTYGIDESKAPVGIVGGQSSTDMPIRTIVYPSYGLDRPPSDPAVLIASYCWSEDAQRLAALIVDFNSSKFDADKPLSNPLAKLVLRDLAKVHNVDLSFLATQVMAIHPWDWNTNKYSMGAYAFFGPGNFKDLYTHMTQPAASGRLHFAGEAISARHSWVVGALDSAWRAVDELLNCSALWKPKMADFHSKWGFSQDWVTPEGIMTAMRSDKSELVPSNEHNLHKQHLYMTQPDLFSME
ncbi:hypothetical protein FIBSPDRAFT_813672 [Athelia psychrophila]|uniref:Amine oxidase domain-containing protein n=1 Tax=Athelia psychrophila TaxID=1759441 RepID=A0A166U9K3_9AGAM|nr:hypothetical protein FIBSPDRAFT_813672 [Fibularhizoctonia sp. CBS 109695]